MDETIDWQLFAHSRYWCQNLEMWCYLPGRSVPYLVAKSIIQSLELIHAKEIVYGSVLNLDNIWLREAEKSGELRVFLADFSLAKVGKTSSKKSQ